MPALNWGIAAAGKVSHDFCVALQALPAKEHVIIAVAAQESSRAESFAKLHGIAKFFGSYRELSECGNIDIVFVGCLNFQHFEVCKLMLDNNKHVLCSQPMCMNLSQSRSIMTLAEKKKLFIMEGIWSRFFPAYDFIRKQIDSGTLGEVRYVNIWLGFRELLEMEKFRKKELGGGVILNLAVSAIQFAQWIFQEYPIHIIADGEVNNGGIDEEVRAVLLYDDNRRARLHLSALANLPNKAIIKGRIKELTVPDFWCPTKVIDSAGNERLWALQQKKTESFFHKCIGLTYEANEVRQYIKNGEIYPAKVPHLESMLFAKIRDDLRNCLNIYEDEIVKNCETNL